MWNYDNSNVFLELQLQKSLFKRNHNRKQSVFKIIDVDVIIHTWSDRALKGIVMDRALPSLHNGTLEFTILQLHSL